MLELAKKIIENIQGRLSKLTINKSLNFLIEEEIKREYTDQSSQGTQEINLKDILPPGIDLGNGEIYDVETREIVKEL